VKSATVDDADVLNLVFSNGASIRVEPDEAYQAWTVAGPDGLLVVSMPGGELAVWSPEEEHS